MILQPIRAAAEKMMIDFKEVTSNIEHQGEKGSIREKNLLNYLRDYIPDKYNISSGIIIDSSGKQSKQQDIVIYDSFYSPLLLNTDSIKMIPIESVYLTIEVKSSLNKTELQKSIENIKSVKSLIKDTASSNLSKNLGVIFAYESSVSINSILDNLIKYNKEINSEYQVNLICILEKGMIVPLIKKGLNKIELDFMEDTIPLITNNGPSDNFMLLYLLIMEHLNNTRLEKPDLIKYAKKASLYDFEYTMPRELIPKDAYYNYEGKLVPIEEIISKVEEQKKKTQDHISEKKEYTLKEFETYLKGEFVEILKKFLGFSGENGIVTSYGHDYGKRDLSLIIKSKENNLSEHDKLFLEKYIKNRYEDYKKFYRLNVL